MPMPRLEPDCTIAITTSSDPAPRKIPECIDGALPPDASACVEWLTGDEMDPYCSDIGANLQFMTFRDEPLLEGSCLEIVCRASDDPDVDCPNA